MSVRLLFASVWLPPWVVRRELAKVERATLSALDCLLTAAGRDRPPAAGEAAGSVRARRRTLALAHVERLAQLIEARGRAAAIDEAREALYEEGLRLGREASARLRMRRTRRDLVRAARVLYHVLGIRFEAQWVSSDAARIEIDRCALACEYTADTCLALSATDAGVVAGLWPGARLEFDERITEGRAACVARLTLPASESEAPR